MMVFISSLCLTLVNDTQLLLLGPASRVWLYHDLPEGLRIIPAIHPGSQGDLADRGAFLHAGQFLYREPTIIMNASSLIDMFQSILLRFAVVYLFTPRYSTCHLCSRLPGRRAGMDGVFQPSLICIVLSLQISVKDRHIR